LAEDGQSCHVPPFETILPSFREEIAKLEGYMRDIGNERLFVTQAEISYINQITIEAPTKPFRPQEWLSFIRPDEAAVDEFNMSTRDILRDQDDVPYGRLHRESATGADQSGRKALSLSFTVRGRPGGGSVGNALDFIVRGRHIINEQFVSSTTPEAHQIWRRIK
jgi:uncharacterized protein (TIGR04255 family)